MRSTGNRYRLLITGGILAAALLSMRYLLPLALPFLVGLAVAWIAEPLARFLSRRAKFPRTLATGAAIGGVYLLLLGLVYLLGRLALQEMDHLASGLPGMVEGLDQAAGPGPGLAIPPGPRRAGAAAAGAGGKHYPAVLQRAPPWRRAQCPGCWGPPLRSL